MDKISICVVGWYYFPKFYKQLRDSHLDVHIVAHRYNNVLDKYKLNYIVIENIGLEYGAYNYYINNIWNQQSDVFFMHDDVEFEKFDKTLSFAYKKIIKKKRHHVSIVPGKNVGQGERFFYMSKKIMKIMVKDYGGVWYDKENFGYTTQKSQPKDWKPRRYNDGGPKFRDRVLEIGKEYNISTCKVLIDNKISLFSRGGNKIKSILNKK